MKRIALSALLAAVPAAAQENLCPGVRTKTVKVERGQTIYTIAGMHLKDPSKWTEILKCNRFPTSEPSTPLPGMTIHIPERLLKRSARFIRVKNKVLMRQKGRAEWSDAQDKGQLYQNDEVRTLADSWAAVRFLDQKGREQGAAMSFAPNTMAVVRPPDQDRFDLQLRSGSTRGRSRIVTPTAEIIPKTEDTVVDVTVEDDFTTKAYTVQGSASVKAKGKEVEIREGFGTTVLPNQAPGEAVRMPDLPAFAGMPTDIEAQLGIITSRAPPPSASFVNVELGDEDAKKDVPELDKVRVAIQEVSVGSAIDTVRVQVSRSGDFEAGGLIWSDQFKMFEDFDLSKKARTVGRLAPGVYWVRFQTTDLLGVTSPFSQAKRYRVTPPLRGSEILNRRRGR